MKTLCEGSVHVALVSLLSDFAPGFSHQHEEEDCHVTLPVNNYNNIDIIVDSSDNAVFKPGALPYRGRPWARLDHSHSSIIWGKGVRTSQLQIKIKLPWCSHNSIIGIKANTDTMNK